MSEIDCSVSCWDGVKASLEMTDFQGQTVTVQLSCHRAFCQRYKMITKQGRFQAIRFIFDGGVGGRYWL